MRAKKITFLGIFVFVFNLAFCQAFQPVTWTWEAKAVSDSLYDLVFTANMETNWTLYSQFTADNGPVPTYFEFTEGTHYQRIDKVIEEGAKKEGIDPVFNVNVIKFTKGPVYFTQRIKMVDKSLPIEGYLTFMTCDDRQCLPPTDVAFSFSFSETATAVPKAQVALGEYPLQHIAIDKTQIGSRCDAAASSTVENASWWWIFVLGFGGGLLAFLTPCVFPMLPLTVGYFTKRAATKTQGLRQALLYGASIIVIYVSLGLLITGIFGADSLNLLSTNAWFNIFFAVLFIVFALSFFGLFEINLPSTWANQTDNLSRKGGLLGIFFMAFTLALVSFSCTGPIIGTLLVQTATGSGQALFGRIPIGPLMGMLGFSTALALPFALFAAFPSWLKSLPKSGGWMSDVKVTLGFVELALALKFLSIADLTEGWKVLPYEAFLGFWIVCALGLSLYFLGMIKFPVNYVQPVRTLAKSGLGLATLCLLAYFSFGFRYSEVSKTFITPVLLSGIAPPAGHSYIYPNDCPLNLNCFKDYEQGLAYAQQSNKPILLDFTGHGCVNCRKMEDNVWSQEGIYELLRDRYVVISLYVDAREKLETPYSSPIDGGMRRMIGNKWADFQLLHFNTQSQPFYVLLSPDGKVLNQPVAYTPNADEYRAFLECGLQ
jgi:thiol:disulfide interchange protein DsbD